MTATPQNCLICGYSKVQRLAQGCEPGLCPVVAGTSQAPSKCLMNGIPSINRPSATRWGLLERVETGTP